ncbi:MAG: SRPBCC family protein [Actinobacteria bacterium]|nr:SRPBCC family protein [Actinomycetota bacterium]
MAEVDESVEVDVPVSTAYNQWTQFEEFPRFMQGVESVRQIDDTHLHWIAKIAGKQHEWDAEITYQDPDSRIAWRATDGKRNTGSVRFEALDGERTRVRVRMTWEAEGPAEALGEALGVDDRGVKSDLERFKELVESRGSETGAWRGEVREGDVTS